MGEQALAKIVQQGEVKARVGQLEAEGIFPIHTAADGIRRLAVGEPFDILHDHDQRQAPGRHLHGTPLGRIEIGKELIIVERAELGARAPHRDSLWERRPARQPQSRLEWVGGVQGVSSWRTSGHDKDRP